MTAQVVESLRDIREFARQLVGERLWPHQEAAAMSTARTTCLLSGRQAGKSRTLAVLALHGAFTRPNFRCLILSAGEDAAKRLLGEVTALTMGGLLARSVVEDNASRVVLSNGSWIACLPASEKAVRGHNGIDLLVLDEAAQISDEMWRAARYTVVAKPGSRIVLAGTPFGSTTRFFATSYRLGLDGVKGYQSFHWPSQISPLVDAELIESWRSTDPDWVYRQEVLAEFVEDGQAYFTADELLGAVADFDMWSPERVRAANLGRRDFFGGAAGLDWGFANDASAVALIAPLEDEDLNADRLQGQMPLFVPYVEISKPRTLYTEWVDRLVEIGSSMTVRVWASELNGPGMAPTQMLEERMRRVAGDSWVYGVNTTARRKQTAFAQLKVLLQQGRLALPRHSELLRQLQGLEFSYSEKTSVVQISVPERVGHDDGALALAQAVSCVGASAMVRRPMRFRPFEGETISTTGGLVMPSDARPRWDTSAIFQPQGREHGREPGW